MNIFQLLIAFFTILVPFHSFARKSSESIRIMSTDKRIFIITAKKEGFSKGDFITLSLGKNKAARALVAKSTLDKLTGEKVAGIKILKICSLAQWNKLDLGSSVNIFRGDDDCRADIEKSSSLASNEKLNSEEDLYSIESLEKELEQEELDKKSRRAIKTDNIVSLTIGLVSATTSAGDENRYEHFAASWAYQFFDNIWGEFSYGRSAMASYPSDGIKTTLENIIFRAKYTFATPFYSFVQPYVGFQIRNTRSPDAGAADDSNSIPQATLDREVQLVDDLKKVRPIIGVTVLKRMVPGWFLRANIGLDIIDFGVSLEF